jgi:copper transport protein
VRPPPWLAPGLVALASLVAPAAALAHADLVAVERRPHAVRLVLSAPVETAFLRLEARTAGGRLVSGPARRDPRDARAIVAPLRAPGTARITWRVLSQDGHPTGGSIAVGAAAAGPGASPVRDGAGPLPVLARLLVLLAPVGLLGLVVLSAAVVAPAVLAGGVSAPGEPREAAEAFRARAGAALERASAGWWTAWWSLVAVGAAGVVLLPVALLRGLRAGPGELGTLLADTRAGATWWVQVAALAAAAIAALVIRSRGASPPAGTGRALALGLPPAVALMAISWAGHASSGADRTVNVVIDGLHGLATAAWLGGLVGLAVLAIPATRALGMDDRVRLGAGVVVRFSALALVAVGVLVVTGVYRALVELDSPADLVETAYGRALLVKLGLFAVMLAVGAYNRMVVHPRLERAALGLADTDRGAGAALRVSVRAELVLAAALIVSVAVLVSLPPPA